MGQILELRLLLATVVVVSNFATVISGNVFYVDGSKGSDQNNGATTEEPFKTIQKCVEALRGPGDECNIRAGRYHGNVLINAKRGTAESPIIIQGYKDEQPIIDGTIELKPRRWRRTRSGVHWARIPTDVWQLFVEDIMMTNARWPNALWSDKTVFLSQHWAKSAAASKRGVMVDNGEKDLGGSGLDATGAMAVLNIGSFNTFTAVVQKHAAGQSSFTYKDAFGDIKFKPHMNQYFLEDKLEFLDQAGEWFYDKKSKRLYVKTSDGKPPGNVRGKVSAGVWIQTQNTPRTQGQTHIRTNGMPDGLREEGWTSIALLIHS